MKTRKNIYGVNPDTGKRFNAQWEVIYHYLKSHPGRGITSLEAITEFGFTRLSAIVKVIEKNTGYTLQRADIAVGTRYGGVVRVRRYWYEEMEG